MLYKEYSISNDTLNSKLDSASLHKEILDSSLGSFFDGINSDQGSNLFQIHFTRDLTSQEESLLDSIVSDHAGESLLIVNHTRIHSRPAFADKKLSDGSMLFNNDDTKSFSVNNAEIDLDYLVPKNVMKINGIEIVGCKTGDFAKLQVLDTPDGTISGVANAVLKTFGRVHLPDGFYRRVSKYDADLIKDMTIRVVYNRKDLSPDDASNVFVNYLLHEVKNG